MRSAPSVSYPVGRSVFSALLRAALWLAGVAAIAAWVATGQVDLYRVAVSAIVLAACGAWAAWSWRREPAGTLAWDGSRWTFTALGRDDHGAIVPALDLQSVLLVRWDAPRAGWFWLDRRSAPEHWDALRRAVHSPALRDPAGAATPGAAP